MHRLPPTLAPLAAILLLMATLSSPLAAQPPTFAEITGHTFGEEITLHHQMERYLTRLAEISERVTVFSQGLSWEGRQLWVAVVSHPDNMRRLPQIRLAAQRLADPRELPPDEAVELLRDQPIIVWLGGSIHGNELSGSEGLLKLLERLATAEDAATLEALRGAVVLIDPMLNPDGRDSFVHFNRQRRGRLPNPRWENWTKEPGRWSALEHRTGHYFFDTNRDWFAHTQPETARRIPTFLAWHPQVMIDAHEMGAGAEFFFDPAGDPFGPFYPPHAREGLDRFGKAYAEAFDRAGFEYMTGERYNYFYPGYTSSYGSYQGAISMLFEQSSSRGLAGERPDGSVRRLGDAIEQQYTAAWTAVATAARDREDLLAAWHRSKRAALSPAEGLPERYLLAPGGDPGHARELVELLLRNGIEVRRLRESARLGNLADRSGAPVGARSFPTGTYVVEAAQPRQALVRVLLAPRVPLDPDFLALARQRIDRGENPRFYDITAWSLPLLFDLPVFATSEGRGLATEVVTARELATPPAAPPRAAYAYLLPGNEAATMAVLGHLRGRGFRVSVLLTPSRIDGEDVPAGTGIVRVGQNDESVHGAVAELAARFRLAVRAVATGLAEPGHPSLGSGDTVPLRQGDIALLAEEPVDAYSFGWAWYVLDRRWELPMTVLRAGDLDDPALSRYRALVVPDLSSPRQLGRLLGEGGRERLRRWVQDGGTLVALGAATDFVRKELGLGTLSSFYPEPEEGREPSPDEIVRPFTVPGAVLRGEVDTNAWLTAGLGPELPVLVSSDRLYLAPEGPPDAGRRVAVRYASQGPLLLSGHAWPESLERLPGAVYACTEAVGEGQIVLFAEDLDFRGWHRGPERLLLNAVLLGPSLR